MASPIRDPGPATSRRAGVASSTITLATVLLLLLIGLVAGSPDALPDIVGTGHRAGLILAATVMFAVLAGLAIWIAGARSPAARALGLLVWAVVFVAGAAWIESQAVTEAQPDLPDRATLLLIGTADVEHGDHHLVAMADATGLDDELVSLMTRFYLDACALPGVGMTEQSCLPETTGRQAPVDPESLTFVLPLGTTYDDLPNASRIALAGMIEALREQGIAVLTGSEAVADTPPTAQGRTESAEVEGLSSRSLRAWLPLGLIAILALLVLVVVAAARSTRSGARGPGLPDERAVGTADWLAARGELARALELTIADLASGTDPRTAVLATYVRLQSTLVPHGLRPLPAETAVEYLNRVLELVRSTDGAARRLTDLFELAMFSPEPLTARQARDARDALLELTAELQERQPALASLP